MSDTPQQFKLREVCRHLLAAGIKPTPTLLGEIDPSFVTRSHGKICLSHGRLGKVRVEEFKRAGWVHVPSKDNRGNGFWHPPKDQ